MKIEKLKRYGFDSYSAQAGGSLALLQNGDFVMYSAAKAREDALLEALKDLTSALKHNPSCKCPNCQAQDVICQIEATQ